jgi:hypothetical protein
VECTGADRQAGLAAQRGLYKDLHGTASRATTIASLFKSLTALNRSLAVNVAVKHQNDRS